MPPSSHLFSSKIQLKIPLPHHQFNHKRQAYHSQFFITFEQPLRQSSSLAQVWNTRGFSLSCASPYSQFPLSSLASKDRQHPRGSTILQLLSVHTTTYNISCMRGSSFRPQHFFLCLSQWNTQLYGESLFLLFFFPYIAWGAWWPCK